MKQIYQPCDLAPHRIDASHASTPATQKEGGRFKIVLGHGAFTPSYRFQCETLGTGACNRIKGDSRPFIRLKLIHTAYAFLSTWVE